MSGARAGFHVLRSQSRLSSPVWVRLSPPRARTLTRMSTAVPSHLTSRARARRILTKLPGVTAVETDVAAKAVAVTLADGADTTQEALLEALLKWGKAAGKEVALAGQ